MKQKKEQINISWKRKQTPNTTLGEDGIVIHKKLQQFNNEQAAENKEDKKK